MLETSEEQFQELLAHLIVRVNKVLSGQHEMPLLGLLLESNGAVDVTLGAADSPSELRQVLSAMQASLQKKIGAGNVLAGCVAFTQPGTEEVTGLLENHENFCVTVKIPIIHEPTAKLDTERMQIEDGSVYLFPIASD